MKIVYFSQFFEPRQKCFNGGRPYDISRYMVEAGHEVHVICGAMAGFESGPWYKLFEKKVFDGIDVTFCRVAYDNKFGFLRRAWSFLYFAFLASIAVLFVKRPDIIFASSTPLTIGIPGYLGAKFKRAPFVFEVRDLMPEAFVESGALKPGPAVWFGEKLESFIYANAVKIMLVSPGFEKKLIERGLPAEKLKTIPLGADGGIFTNVEPNETWLDKYNLRGKKIAIYTGAHGRANGLDYVIEAAECSKNNPEIAYVLLGKGGKKEQLKESVRQKGLTNIVFADAVPKHDVPGILKACDFGLMILRYYGLPRDVLPNKLFDYMFVGLPVLVNFYGPTEELVHSIGCGLFVDPENPRDLSEKLKMLSDNTEICKKMGQKGKEIAWKKYQRKDLTMELLDTFQEVISNWRKNRK